MRFGSAAAGSLFEIRCDVLAKQHHGTHCKDAFTYKLLSLAYPRRFCDPAAVNLVGRQIDGCYEVTLSGARAQGEACDQSTGAGTILGVTFDDPRSVFDGVERVFFLIKRPPPKSPLFPSRSPSR